MLFQYIKMSKSFTRRKTIAKNASSSGTPGDGTVTSIGITSEDGSVIINSGSPVTSSGNIDLSVNLPANNFNSLGTPTINDDNTEGYKIGSFWLNPVQKLLFICISASTGNAVWNQILLG